MRTRRFFPTIPVAFLVAAGLLAAAGAQAQDPLPPPERNPRDMIAHVLGASGVEPTEAAAESLITLLHGPDADARYAALQQVRRLASTILRKGLVHVPRGPDFPPLIPGLVPVLIEASGDSDPRTRELALYALADTRDPAAQEHLRGFLDDEDPALRHVAACLLTEFGDYSGEDQLGLWLAELDAQGGSEDPLYYSHAEMLLAAVSRMTGADLGSIPCNPLLSSMMPANGKIADPYREPLRAWSVWWADHHEERD